MIKQQTSTTDPRGPEQPLTRSQSLAKLDYFVDTFGPENGIKWCGEGKTYAEAMKLHCDVLRAKVNKILAEAEEIENRIALLAIDGF